MIPKNQIIIIINACLEVLFIETVLFTKCSCCEVRRCFVMKWQIKWPFPCHIDSAAIHKALFTTDQTVNKEYYVFFMYCSANQFEKDQNYRDKIHLLCLLLLDYNMLLKFHRTNLSYNRIHSIWRHVNFWFSHNRNPPL